MISAILYLYPKETLLVIYYIDPKKQALYSKKNTSVLKS